MSEHNNESQPLIIDIGNSNARIATTATEQFSQVHVVPVEQLITVLQQQCAPSHEIYFASVANQGVAQALCQHFPAAQQITTPAYAHGVINAYADYRKLGIDRWLALVGLRQQQHGPSIIVDIGTAVTVDVIDEFGQHKGGWIIPGMAMMMSALTHGTAHVFSDQPLTHTAFATNTAQGVSHGCLAAVTGVVEHAVHQAQVALRSAIAPHIVLTGGQGAVVSRVLTLEHQLDPMLVLKGLACYARSNTAAHEIA